MDIHLTAVVEPVVSEVLSTWGVPGLLAAAAIAAAVFAIMWLTKTTSGLTAERETTIKRQMERIDSLAAQLAETAKERDDYRESYLSAKYPGKGHEDIAAQTGMDPVAKEET